MASSICSAAAAAVERSGQLLPRRTRRLCASSWRPSQCSTAAQSVVISTRRDDRLGREQLERLQQRRPAALELAERAQRRGQRHAHGHLALAVPAGSSRSAAANQRAAALGAREAAACPAASSSAIASSSPRRRLLDVVGALGRVGAARRQRLGRPRVGGEPPAAAHRLVHRAAHERVAEDEAARHLGGPDQIEVEQVVERRRAPPPPPARRSRRRGRARTARPPRRRASRNARGRSRQRLELAGDRARHRRRHAGARRPPPSRAARRASRRARAAELLEVERVAAAVAVDRGDAPRRPRSSSSRPRRASLSWPSSSRRTRGPVSAAASRSAACPGRKPSASSTGASGSRRSSAAISSSEAPSLQWRSSSTSTSGCSSAISPSSG